MGLHGFFLRFQVFEEFRASGGQGIRNFGIRGNKGSGNCRVSSNSHFLLRFIEGKEF